MMSEDLFLAQRSVRLIQNAGKRISNRGFLLQNQFGCRLFHKSVIEFLSDL